MLYYGVCHYRKIKNIEEHYKIFNNIDEPDKKFIICSMFDNRRHKIKFKFGDDVIYHFNCGGTILGLELLFEKYKDNDDAYVAFFEEDFRPTTEKWFQTAKNLLGDNHYVGESLHNRYSEKPSDFIIHNKKCSDVYNKFPKTLKWSDGGFYFSTMKKLKEIEESIGNFCICDRKQKYNRTVDGIVLGEVGFPSRIHGAGFTSAIMNRNDYFIHSG